jgi:hypothetical protein
MKKLIPDSLVWKRYGVTAMTGWRWDHDSTLGFPKPIRIRKRKYRIEAELDAFDERRKTKMAEQTAALENARVEGADAIEL